MSTLMSTGWSQQLLHASFDANTSDHYLALLAQRIVTLEQQVLRRAAAVARVNQSLQQAAPVWQLGKPTDFIAAETYHTTSVVDESAQQLLQQFMVQTADSSLTQAYLAQLRQHLDMLEQQCQPPIRPAPSVGLTPFEAQDLPSYAVLCAVLPACFSGFWAGVSPRELSEHSQQPRLHDDTLINVYPPTPEQRADAKALLQNFTPAQRVAVAGLCQTLQRVYRLTWQRDFKPLVLGSVL